VALLLLLLHVLCCAGCALWVLLLLLLQSTAAFVRVCYPQKQLQRLQQLLVVQAALQSASTPCMALT
jgi:hypothetical protein